MSKKSYILIIFLIMLFLGGIYAFNYNYTTFNNMMNKNLDYNLKQNSNLLSEINHTNFKDIGENVVGDVNNHTNLNQNLINEINNNFKNSTQNETKNDSKIPYHPLINFTDEDIGKKFVDDFGQEYTYGGNMTLKEYYELNNIKWYDPEVIIIPDSEFMPDYDIMHRDTVYVPEETSI